MIFFLNCLFNIIIAVISAIFLLLATKLIHKK